MRKIITRTIKSFVYSCKVANNEAETFENINVSATCILKHPEKQLSKLIPSGYTFIRVNGEPTENHERVYMELKDFIANAKPYVKQEGDVEED